MTSTKDKITARYGACIFAFILAAGMGAVSVSAPAAPGNAAKPQPEHTRLAQAGNTFGVDICRDVFRRPGVFAPKHPMADEYGCVHPRDLQYGQLRRPRPEHMLRRTGSGALARWESDWVRDNNKSNHITTFVLGLNRLPSSITIWFRPRGDTNSIYPVLWSWGSSSAGNPVTIELKGNRIRLHINKKRPLHGVWNARRKQWKKYERGSWKVVVLE